MTNDVQFDLTGRRVLVTGAARGIGRATAELLVSSGAQVIVNDLLEADASNAAEEIGGGLWTSICKAFSYCRRALRL